MAGSHKPNILPPTCGCSHAADTHATHVIVAAVAVIIIVMLLLFLVVGVAGVHICGDEQNEHLYGQPRVPSTWMDRPRSTPKNG